MANDAAASFKRKHPNGGHVFNEVLADLLDNRDQAGKVPLEQWTKEHWDTLEAALRKMVGDVLSRDYLYRELPAKVDAAGGDKALMKRTRSEIRRHLDKIKREASNALAAFRDRIEGSPPHVRAMFIADVYAWRKVWRDPNVPAHKRQLVMASLTRADVLEHAPSDHLTTQLHLAVQTGGQSFTMQEGFDFPVAKGKARPGTKNEEAWALELAPILDQAAPEARPLITAPDLAEKVINAMTDYAQRLGDRDSDLLFILMDKFADKAKHANDHVRVTLDEIMDVLGYDRHASGSGGLSFRVEEKAEIRRRIEDLQIPWMTINRAARHSDKGRWDEYSSRVFTIHEKLGQRELGQAPGEPVRNWNTIVFGFGRAWSYRLFEPRGKLVMALQTKALQYHPTKQVYEKRLGKALGFYWRANLGATQARRRILDVVASMIGEAPQDLVPRQAKRLEQALDQLVADRMIGAWRYREGVRMSELDRMPPRWLDRWLEREIIIEAPPDLQALYSAKHKRLAAATDAKLILHDDADIGAALRAYRTAHGISQLRAAELLKVDNSTLSRIENGKTRPSTETAARIASLIRDLQNKPALRNEAASRRDG